MVRKLINSKTGIIKQINSLMRNADQPRLQYMISTMCDSSRFCSQQNDYGATGVALDQTSAWWSALGEGVERYCAVFSDMHAQYFASYSQLQEAGVQALEPADFCLFSDTQYQGKNFSYEKPDKDTVLCWIKGITLPERSPCYIPSALVFNGYQKQAEEQRIVPNIHPGMACGMNLNQAILAAVYEIIERDSMMIWWLNKLPMPGITVPAQNRLHNIIAHDFPAIDKKNIELSFVWLKNDLDVPVIFCLLVDQKAQVVSGGCAARLNPEQALFKAFCEAAQTWLLSLDLKRGEKSNVVGLAQNHFLPKEMVCPTGEYVSGTHIFHNLSFYGDPTHWDILDFIRKPAQKILLNDLPVFTGGAKKSLDCILHQLQKKQVKSPVIVDLTSSDIAEVGLWVVRVFIPGMVPNTPTLYPPLGLKRLYELPAILGYNLKQTHTWNLAPLPYS